MKLAGLVLKVAYFTPETGKLVAERDLGAALSYFRTHWREFAPRPWAEKSIAPEVTTAKLNAVLRAWARQRGEEWTGDAVAKYNAPRLRYYPDSEVAHGFPTTTELVAQYPCV